MYQLMCKNDVRAEFNITVNEFGEDINDITIIGILPTGCTEDNFDEFVLSRNAVKHRSHLNKYLKTISRLDIKGFLDLTHGVNINDCYWIRKKDEDINWADVSLYSNDFDEVIQHLSFDGAGMFGEHISTTSPEFGTNGSFEKCWVRETNGIFMYKRGSDIASNSGLEPYCEVLASQVFAKMKAGIPYNLVKYRGKVASKCKLFNNESLSFRPYAVFGKTTNVAKIVSKYDSIDNTKTFRRILVCDALTLNTDRHLGNHGFLCNSETEEVVHSAPGFDYNLSMLTYSTLDDLAAVRECIDNCHPVLGKDFVEIARGALTSNIRSDLVALKGIELSLPFYDEKFPEKRAKYMTDVVNTQIENVLGNSEVRIYPTFKVDGISNCMKYRLKFNMTQEQWQQDIPRLIKVLGASGMADLEEKIVELL